MTQLIFQNAAEFRAKSVGQRLDGLRDLDTADASLLQRLPDLVRHHHGRLRVAGDHDLGGGNRRRALHAHEGEDAAKEGRVRLSELLT